MDEGGALSDPHRRNGESVGFEGALGLAGERTARGDCAQHRGGRGAGEPGDVLRGGDGSKVEHGGTAGDQHQVGGACGCEGGCFGVRGGVDEGQRGPVLVGGGEHLGEPGGLGGYDDRGLGLAGVAPRGGARLGVEVDDDGGAPGELGGDREVDRERGLAGSALLRDKRNCQHAGMVACCHASGQAIRTGRVAGGVPFACLVAAAPCRARGLSGAVS